MRPSPALCLWSEPCYVLLSLVETCRNDARRKVGCDDGASEVDTGVGFAWLVLWGVAEGIHDSGFHGSGALRNWSMDSQSGLVEFGRCQSSEQWP